MRKRLTAVLVIVILTGQVRSFAQDHTACLTTLSHAESEFAAGRFFGIPGLLKECLDNNSFTNEEKVRVYMLLTQVYLLTDKPTMADSSYLKLLNADPEFIPSDADPIDVVYLSKKFTSTPIFTPHYKIGGNISHQSIIYAQNVISTPDSTTVRHRMLPGWTLGAGLEWNLSDNIGIGIEGLVSQRRFRTDVSGLFKHDNATSEENQFWVDVPLYARYQWHKGNIRPFAYAGASINLLLFSNVKQSYNDRTVGTTESQSDQVVPVTERTRNISYKRNLFNHSLVFGGGVKIKVGKNFILADLRYMPGLSNVVNTKYNNYASKDRTQIDPSMTRFGFMGDIFRLDNMSISVGYVTPIYNPRRATRVKTKSVSRKLMRESDEK
jgi:hypothetical protein